MKIFKEFIIGVVLLSWVNLYAQKDEMSKVVVVESEYRPEIKEAEKISTVPQLTDTAKPRPVIEYTVLPSGLNTQYKIKRIKAAKLKGPKVDELYNSRLKLGLGNYTTPLAEFSIQNLRSDDYSVGAYVYHKSSHSKLKLDDGNKVDAGYGKNRVNIYGKRFYKGVNVDGDVFFRTDKFRYYGYNTRQITDTVLDKKDIRQFYTNFGAKALVYSTTADSSKLDYKIGIQGSYFGDDYKNQENSLKIPVNFGFMVNIFRLELNAEYDYFFRKQDTDASNRQVFQFHPRLLKSNDQWQVQLGANSYFTRELDSKIYIYPEAKFRFSVINKVLDAFVGVYGKLDLNTLQDVTTENPYLMPGVEVMNTSHKLIGYGGIRGVLSSNSGYRAEVSFNSIKDAYFYINDTAGILANQFIPVTDNIEVVKFNGELWYSPFNFLELYFKGKYDAYSMTKEEKPWHKPSFSMSLRTVYNFKEKFYVNFDLLQIGKRYAFDVSDPGTPIELASFWDINLGLEYKYSEVLSAFIEGNNLLAKQYYLWNQYPSQKINIILGFSYKF